MNWRSLVIGALITLLVTIAGGVIVYYVTREPAQKKEENLVYKLGPLQVFDVEKNKFIVLTIRVSNKGGVSAKSVSIGCRFDETMRVLDKGFSASSDLASGYSFTTPTQSQVIASIPSIAPSETVTVTYVLSEKPKDTPIIGVKSEHGMGQAGELVNEEKQADLSKARSVFAYIVALPVGFLIARLMRRLRFSTRSANNTAFVYLHKGLIAEAKEILWNSIRSGGGDALMISNYALCLAMEGDFEGATKRLEAAEFYSSGGHEKAVVCFNRGLALLKAGSSAPAIENLSRALKLSGKEIHRYSKYSSLVQELTIGTPMAKSLLQSPQDAGDAK